MPSVLFVCTANICRSPMAMALFQRRLEQQGIAEDWQVASAGTWARTGCPAALHVQDVLRAWDVDLRAHRSRSVTRELLDAFGLVIVMTQVQQEALLVEFPTLADRIVLLSVLAGEVYDIPDPINGSLSDARAVAQEIDQILERGLAEIVRRAYTSATPKTSHGAPQLQEDV